MSQKSASNAPMIYMLGLIIVVQIISLAMMPTLLKGDVRVFEDPTSTVNPFSYLLLILGFTAFLLLAIRWKMGWILSAVIQFAVAVSVYYVLSAFIPYVPALAISLAVVLVLHFHPEWYVIDAVGLLVSAGVSALFGISMTVLPTLILLVVLAVYDALSVYKTKHMVSLAESAIKIRAPLLFVVPKRGGYSFIRDGRESGGAFFLGLGDAIIPTILAVSANWSLPSPQYFGVNVIAMGTMIGTCFGFLVLMKSHRDSPQAGLPFLNGGAIIGFLLSWVTTL